jgi:radical SAM protein with 4Fe4S-binding SPASM domain
MLKESGQNLIYYFSFSGVFSGLMTDDTLTPAITAVERWLGNPLSRRILKFVATNDTCGNRLNNAIDCYIGQEHELCFKCRFASWMVGAALGRSGRLFDIAEVDLKTGFSDPYFRKGLSNVFRGIAEYGITKPQVVNAPFLVVWDFTHLCNLKCKHCYQDAQKALPGELSTEESKKLIEELSDAGVVVIAFSGGEPLMRKDIFEVAAHAARHDMYVSIATNGTLITPGVAKRLAESGVSYVEISIDGKSATEHDALRGIPGAFDRSVAGIRSAVDAGIFTCIATTVTRDNVDQVPDIHALGKELGVRRIMYFNFIPTGRGVEMVDKDITPRQRENLLKYILDNAKAGNTPLELSTAPQIARVAVDDEEKYGIPIGHFHMGEGIRGKTRMLADFIGGCGAGRLYCSIEPTGTVQPCVFLPVPVGNIREQSFLDIWHQAPVLKQLRNRDQLTGSCGTCGNKFICGGCRARAWAYYRDLNAPDPGCINNLTHWNSLAGQRKNPHRKVPVIMMPKSR